MVSITKDYWKDVCEEYKIDYSLFDCFKVDTLCRVLDYYLASRMCCKLNNGIALGKLPDFHMKEVTILRELCQTIVNGTILNVPSSNDGIPALAGNNVELLFNDMQREEFMQSALVGLNHSLKNLIELEINRLVGKERKLSRLVVRKGNAKLVFIYEDDLKEFVNDYIGYLDKLVKSLINNEDFGFKFIDVNFYKDDESVNLRTGMVTVYSSCLREFFEFQSGVSKWLEGVC